MMKKEVSSSQQQTDSRSCDGNPVHEIRLLIFREQTREVKFKAKKNLFATEKCFNGSVN